MMMRASGSGSRSRLRPQQQQQVLLFDAQLIVDSYYLSRALFAKCKLISRGCVRARGTRRKSREDERRMENGVVGGLQPLL